MANASIFKRFAIILRRAIFTVFGRQELTTREMVALNEGGNANKRLAFLIGNGV